MTILFRVVLVLKKNDKVKCTALLQVFWFGPNQEIIISCKNSLFLLNLGTHHSRMGAELLYNYLYYEEAQFYLDVHTQLFNRPFVIFYFKLTIKYNDSTYLVLSLYITLCQQTINNRKVQEWIMIKYTHKYSYCDCCVQNLF